MIALVDPSRPVARADAEALFARTREAAIWGAMPPESWAAFAGAYRWRDDPGWVYTQGAQTLGWFRWEGEGWRDARAVPDELRLLAPLRAFEATHRVGAGGAQAFARPEAAAATTTLMPGVQVMLTEARGTWACVLAENGWNGWVDGRALEDLEPFRPFDDAPVAPAQPAMTPPAVAAAEAGAPAGAAEVAPTTPAPAFVPTHTIPVDGMPAWALPDPSQMPVATLGLGLPVRVIERLGAWARIACDNGWTGWVDGRALP